ncbi:disulfide bond formation protein B [Oceanisphaera profunda]|uniref:Disulfide bond formation protein B n=1 Tax=Oceanisphaera profunda TaxID=1416627 RepID=A0A1Y0D150_9GAMM|nr:disulfide bond formation protein DsbB [Oceanisphaera profunda]ART81251.1 disulfide bond formation protein B [Oceanisphaera profunda]
MQRLFRFSRSRSAWALLTLGSALLLAIALFFQYGLKMAPCVMCVYQRAALVGVMLAGALGWLAPRQPLLSSMALLGWLAAASKGLLLAKEHIHYQFNPSPFAKCTTVAEFPSWLPLERLLPSVFFPSGDCADVSWSWLGLSMPQWLLGIFAVLAALALLFIVVRLVGAVKRERH